MPEGDTLWRIAAALTPRITGKEVRRAEPAPFRRLTGKTVEAVEATGKHLLIRFDNGLALHSHLGMNGAWHIYAPGQAWRRPAHSARAVLEFDDAVIVAFQPRTVELIRVPAAGPPAALAALGPDILGEPFDRGVVLRRARAADAPAIGELLLDQQVCAGIGNIYRCETLWAHRVDPWQTPSAIDDDQLGELYATARRLMREGALAARIGRSRAVHGRAGRPCPRCGTPVEVRPQGRLARLTYHCPRCQGAAKAAGAGRVGRST